MDDLTDADREAFERWFGASKYCQVVYSAASYQPCLDGYAAGRAAERERCARLCESFGRAHTYASENADHYRGFDAGTAACAKRIRAGDA